MMQHLHDRLYAFLLNLECLDLAGQHDAFVMEVLETNGQLVPPAGDRSHFWELRLHGLNALGASDEEAIANWKRLAAAHCKLDETGEQDIAPARPATASAAK